MNEKESIELHAFIAQHVMKWRRVNFAIVSKGSFCVMDTGVYTYASPNSMAPFAPTTDRAAAMEVLEKCVTKVATRSMEIYQGVNEGPEFRPCFCVTMEGMSDVMFADTLPLAICLFAKKIYEKEK